MIRMLEDEVRVLCREEDKDELADLASGIEEEYAAFMQEKTGREYACSIVVKEDKFLTDDMDKGCGGVIVFNANEGIMCQNMIFNRLNQAFEECLPSIR